MEKVEKLVYIGDEERIVKEKNSDEALVVFHLKNQGKIAYLVDLFTLKDVRRRLEGGLLGILKIGNNHSNRLELNNVQSVSINNQPFKA